MSGLDLRAQVLTHPSSTLAQEQSQDFILFVPRINKLFSFKKKFTLLIQAAAVRLKKKF